MSMEILNLAILNLLKNTSLAFTPMSDLLLVVLKYYTNLNPSTCC